MLLIADVVDIIGGAALAVVIDSNVQLVQKENVLMDVTMCDDGDANLKKQTAYCLLLPLLPSHVAARQRDESQPMRTGCGV